MPETDITVAPTGARDVSDHPIPGYAFGYCDPTTHAPVQLPRIIGARFWLFDGSSSLVEPSTAVYVGVDAFSVTLVFRFESDPEALYGTLTRSSPAAITSRGCFGCTCGKRTPFESSSGRFET